MVKFCGIGDPHGDMKKIRQAPKDVDFYLVTGDLGKAEFARKIYFENIKRKEKGLSEFSLGIKENKKIYDETHFSTLKVLDYLKRKAPVYSIEGNVGVVTVKQARRGSEEKGFRHIATRKVIDDTSDVHLVKNVVRNLGGIRVGFLEYFLDTSWVREFGPKDYREEMKKAKKESEKARNVLKRFGHVDILVCHQPPYGVLDQPSSKYGAPKKWWGKHAGSKVILNYVRRFKPRYVFCGHIHEGEGRKKVGESKVFNLGVGGFRVIEIEKD